MKSIMLMGIVCLFVCTDYVNAQSTYNSRVGLYVGSEVGSSRRGGSLGTIGFRFNNFDASLSTIGTSSFRIQGTYANYFPMNTKWGYQLSAGYLFGETFGNVFQEQNGFEITPGLFRRIDLNRRIQLFPTLQLYQGFRSSDTRTNLELSLPIKFHISNKASLLITPSYQFGDNRFFQQGFNNQFRVGIGFQINF